MSMIHHVSRLLYRRQNYPTEAPGWSGDYPSFEAALSECKGYDDPTITHAVAGRRQQSIDGAISHIDERFLSPLAAIGVALSRLNKRSISVLEYGGGNGAFADIVRHYFPDVSFAWTIVETQSMVDACRSVQGIRWLTELPQSERFDLVLFCGSLQYLPHPHQTLEQCAGIASWVVLQRLPLGPRNLITRQIVSPEIHAGSYPVTFFDADEFETRLSEIGRIFMRWTVEIERNSLPFDSIPRGFLLETGQDP